MTADGAKSVTQELIRDASMWVKQDLEQKGLEDVTVAPAGWFVYAEEEGDIRRWITGRDPTPEEVEQAGDIGFILCISGQIGSATYDHAVDMCDNSFEDGKWYLHGAYPSKTVDLRGEEHEVFKVHGWMLPPEAC
jgi:hypothetical protein